MRSQNKTLTLIVVILLMSVMSTVYAQSDWHKYPVRSMNEIITAHSDATSRKSDLIVSADPFPSKTVLTYTGQHRPVDEWKKYFIGVWAESRNVTENAKLLTEEYLFKEKGTDHWMPVVKQLTPHFEKELKVGDEITAYYFFLGGYNEKTLREKSKDKKPIPPSLGNNVEWVFVLEEYQKPSAVAQATTTLQSLSAPIDPNLKVPNSTPFLIDPRQVRSNSRVIFTGERRAVSEGKKQFLQAWLVKRSLPASTLDLLLEEMRFREGNSDYWMPVRKKTLDTMIKELKAGDEITIQTILAGGISHAGSTEWIFVVGEFAR